MWVGLGRRSDWVVITASSPWIHAARPAPPLTTKVGKEAQTANPPKIAEGVIQTSFRGPAETCLAPDAATAQATIGAKLDGLHFGFDYLTDSLQNEVAAGNLASLDTLQSVGVQSIGERLLDR